MLFYWWLSNRDRRMVFRGKRWECYKVVRVLTSSLLQIGRLFIYRCRFLLSVHLSRLCKFCSIKNPLRPKCLNVSFCPHPPPSFPLSSSSSSVQISLLYYRLVDFPIHTGSLVLPLPFNPEWLQFCLLFQSNNNTDTRWMF